MVKRCPVCQEFKDDSEFAWKFRGLGIRSATCKSCHNLMYGQAWYEQNREKVIEAVAERRRRNKEEAKEWIIEYLRIHPCVDCGETDLSVLEFDHLGNKKSEVGKLIHGGYSLAIVQAEVMKCEVRCANCHRKKTARDQGWYKR